MMSAPRDALRERPVHAFRVKSATFEARAETVIAALAELSR
ncbi:MAG TPA: hypothetical protein VFH51_17935 [Myxococcota bacterium]|nr:hypothetical protein [Myxococcota bacterium]